MNKRNEWQNILRLANEALNPKGAKIEIKNDGFGNYECIVTVKGKPETYAENYYEGELDDLVTEAWHYADQKVSFTRTVDKVKAVSNAMSVLTNGQSTGYSLNKPIPVVYREKLVFIHSVSLNNLINNTLVVTVSGQDQHLIPLRIKVKKDKSGFEWHDRYLFDKERAEKSIFRADVPACDVYDFINYALGSALRSKQYEIENTTRMLDDFFEAKWNKK